MKKKLYLFLIFFVLICINNTNAHIFNESCFKSTKTVFDQSFHKRDEVLIDSIVIIHDSTCVGYPYIENGFNIPASSLQIPGSVVYSQTIIENGIVITFQLYLVKETNVDTTLFISHCQDSPYFLNGYYYYTSGTYNQQIIAVNGCDSNITLHLTMLPVSYSYFLDTVCINTAYSGFGFTVPANFYSTSGTYVLVDTLIAQNGCDSIVTLNLTVLPNPISFQNHLINQSQIPYTFNNLVFTNEVNNYPITILRPSQCDSLIYFTLQINWNVTTQLWDTICQNELPIVWNGVLFNSAGFQTVIFPSYLGTDSIVSMSLTVFPNTSSSVTTTITEDQLPFTYNGYTFTDEVINFPITISNFYGCDSIISYTLLVNWNTYESIDTTVCSSSLPILWRGFLFNQGGIVYDTLINSNLSLNFQTLELFVDTIYNIMFNGFSNPICPTILNQQIIANVNTGIPPYSYNWSGDSILSSFQNQVLVKIAPAVCNSNRYIYLAVTDSIGCIARDTVVLQLNTTQLPYLSSAIPSQNSIVNNCQYTIPNLTSVVRSYAFDDCYPSDSLTITQNPVAGTLISTNSNVTVTISNPCGNSIQTTVSITVPTPLTVAISNIVHVLCYGQSTGGATAVPSNGTPSYGYSWSTQSTPSTIISTNNSISGVSAGTYRVTVTDGSGCTATTTVTIQHQSNAMNPGTLGSDQTICYGQIPSTIIGTTASGGNNSTYLWQTSLNNTLFTNASGINNMQNYSPTAITQNTYYRRAWISTACGTVYSDTLIIQVFPQYRDTIQDDVCLGYEYIENGFNLPVDSTQIAGIHFFTKNYTSINNCDSIVVLKLNVLSVYETTFEIAACISYTWNDIIYTETGEYIQSFNAINGCDSTVTLLLEINPVQLITILDTICQGGIYEENGFLFAPPLTNSIQPIEDEITFTSVEGCDSTISLYLTIIDTVLQIEQLTNDFCQNYTTSLFANGNFTNFYWSTGEGSQTITVNSPGIYTVTASNEYCERSSNIVILPCSLAIYIPNSFTPNGDGLNDHFAIYSFNISVLEEFKIKIYNRWGQIVFESNDPYFVWDGTTNSGTVLKNTTYSYVIEYKMQNEGSKFIAGSITVL